MPDDEPDDEPIIYIPVSAQIHYHDSGAEIPPDWTWLTGRTELASEDVG